MKRREFIRLLGGTAVAWPPAASAQQPGGMRRIGLLISTERDDYQMLNTTNSRMPIPMNSTASATAS